MSTFFLDLLNGNDAGNGLSWGAAKKTLSGGSGITSLTIAAGDEVRVAKTTDAPVLSGTLTWNDNSTSVNTSADQTAVLAAGDFISPSPNGEQGWHQIASLTSTVITLTNKYYVRQLATGGNFLLTTGTASGTAGSGAAKPGYWLQHAGANGTMISNSGLASSTFNKAGSSGNNVLLTGGWNTGSGLRDGWTMIDSLGVNTNAFLCSASFVTISYIGVFRSKGFEASADSVTWDHCHAVTSNQAAYYFLSNNKITITDCWGVNGGGSFAMCQRGGHSHNITRLVAFTPSGASGAIWYENSSPVDKPWIMTGVECYGATTYGMGGHNQDEYYSCVAAWCVRGFYGGNMSVYGGCAGVNNTTGDFGVAGVSYCNNCLWSSTTPVFGRASNYAGTASFDRWQQTAGTYRFYSVDTGGAIKYTIRSDTSNPRGGSGTALAIFPAGNATAGALYCFHVAAIPIDSGVTRTVSFYARKDGGTWNGSNLKYGLKHKGVWVVGPTLIPIGTLTTSYVQTILTGFVGTETGCVELWIGVDGNAGNVYIDDIAWT